MCRSSSLNHVCLKSTLMHQRYIWKADGMFCVENLSLGTSVSLNIVVWKSTTFASESWNQKPSHHVCVSQPKTAICSCFENKLLKQLGTSCHYNEDESCVWWGLRSVAHLCANEYFKINSSVCVRVNEGTCFPVKHGGSLMTSEMYQSANRQQWSVRYI